MGVFVVRWASLTLNSEEHSAAQLAALLGEEHVTYSSDRGELTSRGNRVTCSTVEVAADGPSLAEAVANSGLPISPDADRALAEVLRRVLPRADALQAYLASMTPARQVAPPAMLEIVAARFGEDTQLDLSPETVRDIGRLGLPFRVTTYRGSDDPTDLPEEEAAAP